MTNFGIDKRLSLTVNFHRRRLTEDQDLYIREGDFIAYGDDFFEIATINYTKQIFGQGHDGFDRIFEAQAKCIRAREGTFDGS